MKKVFYQRWVFGEVQDVNISIEVLDGYNKTKFGKGKSKDESLLIEAARYAHENELIYFVTIFEDDKPFCHLEINKGFYRVNFLDEYLRTYMAYDFTDNYKSVDASKLFLSQIMFWDFEGSTEKVLTISDHIFKADGTFLTIEKNLATNEQINSEAKNKIDVSANWEEYPEFGKYDWLIKKERNLKSI